MAVTVRLQRHGKKKVPFFHLVAADSRKPCRGRFLEKIGYYDPKPNPSLFVCKQERLQHWFGLGATLSNSVRKLLQKNNIKVERAKITPPKKNAK